MRIWHVNVGNRAGAVDGVAVVATQLARDQAALGHDVRLLVDAAPEHHEALRSAAGDAVVLSVATGGAAALRLGGRLLDDPGTRPEVVHLHSVFRPVHRVLAARARRQGVPVVLSPHSGLAPALLERDRARKWAYGRLVERRFHRSADGVHALQLVERDDIVGYCGRPRDVAVIPNPADPSLSASERWRGSRAGRPRIVTLCRYDVYQKGLDRLASMALLLPDVDFHVYGQADKNAPALAAHLIAAAPPNVAFEPPVYGDEKLRVLRDTDVFCQPSRAEGLSVALVEAMTLGVPCAVSDYVGRSLAMGPAGTALVLDDDPARAAPALATLLGDRDRLAALGREAARYAAGSFAAVTVAAAHLAHYARVGAGAPPPGPQATQASGAAGQGRRDQGVVG